jgi:hypothetical protein
LPAEAPEFQYVLFGKLDALGYHPA